MFKKIGLSGIALAAMLVLFAPSPASARVRIGVTFGAPAYTAPALPYYNNPYAYGNPDLYAYNNYDPYYAPGPAYVYPAPTYVAPYSSFAFGWGDRDRHEWREHEWREHEHHEFRGGWRR